MRARERKREEERRLRPLRLSRLYKPAVAVGFVVASRIRKARTVAKTGVTHRGF